LAYGIYLHWRHDLGSAWSTHCRQDAGDESSTLSAVHSRLSFACNFELGQLFLQGLLRVHELLRVRYELRHGVLQHAVVFFEPLRS
jgi:hypothetical protein